ncbi:unnamed protein product [Thlaspi arvense]|uniref:Uncharacterized protein n=1 Tax=Thlaspi arvense TaxID=13288 RepID=A0AAU9RKZ9_THLAR|nr:unnamed protein product [Thlaspi arvense]
MLEKSPTRSCLYETETFSFSFLFTVFGDCLPVAMLTELEFRNFSDCFPSL